MRIENDIDRACVFVFVKNLRPGLAAVGRAEDAALRVRPVGVSDCGDEDDVGIIGIDDEGADMAGVAQADVAPVAAAIDATL
jgi:hypothetical protein